ncbi:MAG TPA: LysR substrate-binding domain-containing protein [Stellaceae bacterium]|jgi:LysR family glycine cleavage system transcriptional activator|nr:LysR substrate-binding domain-containing protein [Stellaceae bacterium]
MRRLPPLSALRIFEIVAREGGVSAASAQLGMTPGAVSKQVLKLEAWLGRKLFSRAGRGLQLAPAGADLLRELGSAFDRIELACRRLEEGRQPGLLRVTAPPTFMTHWLIPRLGRFQQLHPGISIQLDNRHDRRPGLPDRTDIAIRRGPPEDASLSVVPMMPEAVTPVCRPDMAGLERLKRPADLGSATWLTATMRPHDWQDWLNVAGLPELQPAHRFTFDHTYLALGAAADALGVAMGPLYLIDQDLRAGRLAAPFIAITCPKEGYYLVCDTDREDTPALSAFRAWLLAEGTEHAAAVEALVARFRQPVKAPSRRILKGRLD